MKFYDRLIKCIREGFFPPVCLKCRRIYKIPNDAYNNARMLYQHADADLRKKNHFRSLISAYLCTPCISDFNPVKSPQCSRCGLMFKSREGTDHVCGTCLKADNYYNKARAFAIYNGVFKDLIPCYKYQNKLQLVKPFSFFLFSAFRNYWDNNAIDIITPVPLHIRRMRKRGFNQAYQLVHNWRKVAQAFNCDLTPIRIEREILVRTRWTQPQVGMKLKDRQANIKNAFAVKIPEKVKGQRILLIDDVITSGATVNECAKVLLNHGARHVDVLTLAQANKFW
ncbi:ComF family protein [Desulfococcaceae bacterium HSG7]|nr:ComF family protein [Desulfococcaceae bacterium HSG7]